MFRMQTTLDSARPSVFATLACVVVGYALGVTSVLVGRGDLFGSARSEPSAAVQATQPATVQPLAAIVAAEPTVTQTLQGARSGLRTGSADALVQLVLFEDGQCPFCKKLSDEVIARVISESVGAGEIAVTYRHYPFLGPESDTLAVAMECAGQQNRFWPFHDLIFADQQPENTGAMDQARLEALATGAQLDSATFAACLADPASRAAVDADLSLGRKLGVRGTPTLFVNGKRLVGAVPYEFVRSAIDDALHKR
jgi:protein-disulfide isomerase